METFDVRVWKIREHKSKGAPAKGKSKATYSLRWVIGGKLRCRSFATRALADSYRSRLVSASRDGETFDVATGEPVSWARSDEDGPTWFEHAMAFVDMKWPNFAPTSRRAAADALASITPVLVVEDRHKPSPVELRRALYCWAFNAHARKKGAVPVDLEPAITWLEKHSLPLVKLAEPPIIRNALDAAARKLDGTFAAATTANRKRFVLHEALGYAVELGRLPSHPMDHVRWSVRRSTEIVDRRVVVNPEQARALLNAVERHSTYGERLVAFFALLYFAAFRPAEALELAENDCDLPAKGWGTLYLARSTPRSGAAWTDSGKPRDTRGLKHRPRDEVRPVPACPELVGLLRAHIEKFSPAPHRPLVTAARGGTVPEGTYGRIWREAREKVFTPAQAASPLAARPYDLRHAAVSTWLNAGVPPTQVAEWAGHGVDVLLRVYAKCLDGQDAAARHNIERALATPDEDDTSGERREDRT